MIKSFKQFLKEMPGKTDTGPDYLDDTPVREPSKYEDLNYSGHSFGNYNLKTKKSKSGTKPFEYQAEHDNGEVHFVTRGGTTEDNHFIANETRKHTNSEINAPTFYKEILKHGEHAGIQSGKDHTSDGEHIWYRMAHNHPDVEITHHRTSDMKQIPLHKGEDWSKNYNENEPSVFRMKFKEK